MKLGPTKRKEITIRSNKKTPIEALRAILRESLKFINECENIGQVKWKVEIVVREKRA